MPHCILSLYSVHEECHAVPDSRGRTYGPLATIAPEQ